MGSRKLAGHKAQAASLVLSAVLLTGLVEADGNAPTATYVTQLEAVYRPPSEQGFGSAVFHQALRPGDDLAVAALSVYRRFVGPRWQRFGEQAWMKRWREVYFRSADAQRHILVELRSIEDRDAQRSMALLLDATDEAAAARAALAFAFDDSAVTEMRVFNLGDGEAISGLLVAGRRAAAGNATYVIVLMD